MILQKKINGSPSVQTRLYYAKLRQWSQVELHAFKENRTYEIHIFNLRNEDLHCG